jgi:hypothetical protein
MNVRTTINPTGTSGSTSVLSVSELCVLCDEIEVGLAMVSDDERLKTLQFDPTTDCADRHRWILNPSRRSRGGLRSVLPASKSQPTASKLVSYVRSARERAAYI